MLNHILPTSHTYLSEVRQSDVYVMHYEQWLIKDSVLKSSKVVC